MSAISKIGLAIVGLVVLLWAFDALPAIHDGRGGELSQSSGVVSHSVPAPAPLEPHGKARGDVEAAGARVEATPQKTIPAVDDIGKIEAGLLQCTSLREALSLVRQLKSIGTPEAIGVIIRFMEASEPFMAGKARLLATELVSITDVRIGPAAVAALEAAIQTGHQDGTIVGYADLVASNGSVEDAARLLDRMSDKTLQPGFRAMLADALARPGDRQFGLLLLDQIAAQYADGNAAVGNALAKAAARSQDAEVQATLLDMARNGVGLDTPARSGLYRAWGASIDTPQEITYLVSMWSALSQNEQEFAVDALGAVMEVPAADRHSVLDQVRPALEDALINGSASTLLSALSILDDNRRLLSSQWEAILLQAAARAPTEAYADRARSLAREAAAR